MGSAAEDDNSQLLGSPITATPPKSWGMLKTNAAEAGIGQILYGASGSDYL